MQKNEKKRFSFEKDDRSPSQLREGRFQKPPTFMVGAIVK